MTIRGFVERAYAAQVDAFRGSLPVQTLLSGEASRSSWDSFLEALAKTHFASGQYLGFLYAVAPPGSLERVKHNLLEELGLDGDEGESHGSLMETLLHGAGLGHRIPALREAASDSIRERVAQPLVYGTLREVGFTALVEISAFEWLLAHVATPLAQALETYRGVPRSHLLWLTHHSEVDLRHAQEALDTIEDYARYHGLDDDDAEALADATLRENVYLRRYFGPEAAAQALVQP